MASFESLPVSTIAKMCFAAVCIYFYILLITRVAGKRTFAKMSSFDFAVTIAMGSILADAVNKPISSLLPAFVSLALLAGLQVFISKVLSKSDKAQKILTNTPILLMKNGKILEKNLEKALVSKANLMGKLREANVIELSQVKAVIFETTGDVCVLHSTNDIEIDAAIMEDVASF